MVMKKASEGGAVERHEWKVDVSDAVDARGSFEIAVDLVEPVEGQISDVVLCCLPGGSLSRKYFDLEIEGDRRFSFAEFMAQRGFRTLAFDHLGVGDSTLPEPEVGYTLGVDALCRANQRALEIALDRIRSSASDATGLCTVGVGHSMGSALSVAQQALARPHDALVLFSFTTAGLPHLQPPEERHLAHDPDRARAEMPEIVRARYGTPFAPAPAREGADASSAFSVGTAPPEAARALLKASTRMLAIPGLLTMVPGAYSPYAEKIDVPVFVGVGDHDLHAAHGVGEMLPNTPEVALYTLADCWHCHNVANTRERLWGRVAHWIHGALAPTD